MISKLQEFVDNIRKVLSQNTTNSIAAPSPVEAVPPPPRTAVPDVATVEDNTKIEAGPTKKGAMAAALAMTLQRLNNVQALNEAGKREVAIRQADREAAAEAHRIESAQRLADEKNLLNFKETLPSNMDARATNKAYREAMTRNANLGADLKQARLSGTMPTAGRSGSRSAAPTSDNVVLDDAAYQELANSGVDIKNLSDKDLKRIYFAMNRKSATGTAPKDVDKEAAIREKIVRIQSNIERRKEFNPTAGPTEDEAALLGHYRNQLGTAPTSAPPVKGNSIDDQTAAFLAKKQQTAPAQTVAPTTPAAANNLVEFKGDDGRTYKIDKITGKIYVK